MTPTKQNNTSSRFKVLLPDWEQLPVQVMPDDHSEVVPLLPIPNRTVKRLSADDSADSRVKVGHCQANIRAKPDLDEVGLFAFLRPDNSAIHISRPTCSIISVEQRSRISCKCQSSFGVAPK